MAKVHAKDTNVEKMFGELLKPLYKKGKYKRNVKTLMGKPDFVFYKSTAVIFIDGCFWHGCKKHYKQPKSRVIFWKNKIEGNIKRDREVNKNLKRSGWKVLRIWEHEIVKDSKKVSDKVIGFLKDEKIINNK